MKSQQTLRNLVPYAFRWFIDIDVTITRAEFADILKPIVKRVHDITKQILHEIRFEPELIDTVLMVGGSSLIPAIQTELKNIFGTEKVMIHPRPMLAIAEGAALMAAKMANQETAAASESFAMMHSTAHDYYLQLAGGKRHLLVARNTPLPITVEEKLTFTHQEQSLARLRVLNEVEGVLDTVGELWFHKEKTTVQHNKDLTQFMLQFSVNEDNIITMKAWSLQNEHQVVETQIARGGLAAKLYNDLENNLSSIISHSDRGSVAKDALKLSRTIVTTILSVSDPITGETRPAQKQKAQNQIKTLKECQEKDIAPICTYQFAELAEKQATPVIAAKDHARFKHLVHEFKQAIDNLTDIEHIERVWNAIQDFYDEIPIVSTLAQAENAARVTEIDSPMDAKAIRNQAKKLTEVHKSSNKALLEETADDLHYLIHSNVSYRDAPTGRFDRDVKL